MPEALQDLICLDFRQRASQLFLFHVELRPKLFLELAKDVVPRRAGREEHRLTYGTEIAVE